MVYEQIVKEHVKAERQRVTRLLDDLHRYLHDSDPLVVTVTRRLLSESNHLYAILGFPGMDYKPLDRPYYEVDYSSVVGIMGWIVDFLSADLLDDTPPTRGQVVIKVPRLVWEGVPNTTLIPRMEYQEEALPYLAPYRWDGPWLGPKEVLEIMDFHAAREAKHPASTTSVGEALKALLEEMTA